MGKIRNVSVFEWGMVVGLSVSRTTMLLFNAQQFPVCNKNVPPPKGQSTGGGDQTRSKGWLATETPLVSTELSN